MFPIAFRPMTLEDLDKGFVPTLSVLRTVDTPQDKIQKIFDERITKGICTYVLADREHVFATATMIIETKYYRNGGKVAHIEDVAVHPDHQKNGYGKMIMEGLKTEAVAKGCYKMILDCSDKNIQFYERCGYKKHEVQMRLDLT